MSDTDSPTTPPEGLRALFAERFGAEALSREGLVCASAPGRVELAGNHTDLQGGRTISAAVDRRCWALAAPNGGRVAHVLMEGFGEAAIELDDLSPREEERQSSAALVRGMGAARAEAGGRLEGFDMAVVSDVPAGRGISSSAAFEMLVGQAMAALFDEPGAAGPDKVELALAGMRSEQEWFGKLAGAQDQLASCFGGVNELDFAQATPRVAPIDFDPAILGCRIVLVDAACDHARYPEDFSDISRDMYKVAQALGAERLIEVPRERFFDELDGLRARLGDRAVLRALHFYEETARVERQARALREGDPARFLALVRQSGASSAEFLQNISPRSEVEGTEQPAAVVLALCAHLLDGTGAPGEPRPAAEGGARGQAGGARGACRIHGGGFGGAALAFVPEAQADSFVEEMDRLLGYAACMPVRLSPQGACARRLAWRRPS